jgi:hypothetical protein
MNYTDQDILDLETTLEGIGHETMIQYRLAQPKSWVTPEGGLNFQNSVIVSFGSELEKNSIKSWFGHIRRNQPKQPCVYLQGSSIKTKLLMEKIKEKFQIEDVNKEESLDEY